MIYVVIASSIVLVLLLIVLVLRPKRARYYEKLHPTRTKIFVSVPSFRDTACNETINSAFENAANPERIVIGACEQNSVLESESCMRGKNVAFGEIRVISIPANQARGPCLARYYCATLYRGEDVYLQIDSHSLFCKDWDLHAVEMLNTMPYSLDRAVISTHPIDSSIENWQDYDVPVITNAKWDGTHLTFQGTFQGKGFKTARQIGAGFMLCHGSVVDRVPLDPGLAGLFNNEEILYSARLYTHGIDIIGPSRNIVAHKYSYEDHKVPWDEKGFSWDADTGGKRRAERLLLGKLRDPVYGMGTERSLKRFWRSRKIDFATKRVEDWHCASV